MVEMQFIDYVIQNSDTLVITDVCCNNIARMKDLINAVSKDNEDTDYLSELVHNNSVTIGNIRVSVIQ